MLDLACYNSAREHYKTSDGKFNTGVEEKLVSFVSSATGLRCEECRASGTDTFHKITNIQVNETTNRILP